MASDTRMVIKSNHLGNVPASVRRKVSAVVKKTTSGISTAAAVAIQNGPKTGRVYGGEVSFFATGRKFDVMRVSFTAKEHQASAPGEAPATETGNLVNSIQQNMPTDITGVVSVGAEYGAALEFGTVHMAARPFIGPAVEQEKPFFISGIAAAVKSGAENA